MASIALKRPEQNRCRSIEGFSQAEVAVELGLTEAAARKRYQRAMRRLNDALQEIP